MKYELLKDLFASGIYLVTHTAYPWYMSYV